MVTVDLITGFLGAGKTTFIKSYLKYLKKKNLNVFIIENEFGETAMDAHMLHEDTDKISDLSGMCMCCTGKDAFISLLLKGADSGFDKIIVEPSGIYDVDEFFEVMSLPNVSEKAEIGSIITIADPFSLKSLTKEARYLAFTQLVSSGITIFSKVDLIKDAELENAKEEIDLIMKENGAPCLLSDLLCKKFTDFTDSDFSDIESTGYFRTVHERKEFIHRFIFDSFEMEVKNISEENLKSILSMLFKESDYGVLFRIKGYVRLENQKTLEINCTPHIISIKETDVNENVLTFIGQKLKEKAIKKLFL